MMQWGIRAEVGACSSLFGFAVKYQYFKCDVGSHRKPLGVVQ